MKRTIFALSWLLICLIIAPACYAEGIKVYDVRVNIDDNKRVTANEDLTIDFGPTRTDPFVRVMPGRQINGEVTANEIINGTAILTGIKSSTDEENGNVAMTITSPGMSAAGTHIYKFEYHTDNAINMDDDKAEFVWSATGDKWMMPIARVALLVTLPTTLKPEEIEAKATVGKDKNQRDVKIENGGMFLKCSTDNLYPGDDFTIRVKMPKSVFRENAPKPKDEPSFWETDAGRGTIGGVVILLIGLVWCLMLAKKDQLR